MLRKRPYAPAIIIVMMLALGGCRDTTAPENGVLPQGTAQSETPPSAVSSEPVEAASINIQIDRATDELMNQYRSVHEYINDENGEWVIIRTDAKIKDFAFITVDHKVTGEEIFFAAGEILGSAEELSPEKPFAVKFLIPGLIPSYGVSFREENGALRYYTINLSGRGGEETSPYFLLEFENGGGE